MTLGDICIQRLSEMPKHSGTTTPADLENTWTYSLTFRYAAIPGQALGDPGNFRERGIIDPSSGKIQDRDDFLKSACGCVYRHLCCSCFPEHMAPTRSSEDLSDLTSFEARSPVPLLRRSGWLACELPRDLCFPSHCEREHWDCGHGLRIPGSFLCTICPGPTSSSTPPTMSS